MSYRFMKIAACSALAIATCGLAGSAQAGKPSVSVTRAPVLLYLNKSGDIEVSNGDGQGATIVVPAGGIHRPNWSPDSESDINSAANPAHVVYEQPICTLREIDVWVENNVIKTGPRAANGTLQPRILPKAAPSIQELACAADMSGRELVFGEAHTSTPTSDLFVMERDGSGSWSNPPIAIYGVPYDNATSTATITWASFSPDGRSIAFVEDDGILRIKVIDRASGVVSTVLSDPAYDPTILEWSPTENTLAFAAKGYLYTLNLSFDPATNTWSGNTLRNIASAPGGSPTWSANGQQIYFVNSNGVSTMTRSAAGTWSLVKLIVRGASRPRHRN